MKTTIMALKNIMVQYEIGAYIKNALVDQLGRDVEASEHIIIHLLAQKMQQQYELETNKLLSLHDKYTAKRNGSEYEIYKNNEIFCHLSESDFETFKMGFAFNIEVLS